MAGVTREDLVAFEDGVKAQWEAGELPCLLHLCGGNEGQLLDIFKEVKPGDWILSSHRNHYHALLAGIPSDTLRKSINAGRSMFTYSREHNFLCSAVLAGTACIAAGIAWALEEEKSNAQVWCFIGDGGEEQGHFYEAVMFVEANNLPCVFVIEDNDRSVDTDVQTRRGQAPGLESIFTCVRRYHYKPTYPHAGSGCNFKIEFKPDAIERMRPK